MRITRATTYIVGNPWKNWLFVRLDTDQDGLYGIGEGTLRVGLIPFFNADSGVRRSHRARSRADPYRLAPCPVHSSPCRFSA